jgi:hypothetical protein
MERKDQTKAGQNPSSANMKSSNHMAVFGVHGVVMCTPKGLGGPAPVSLVFFLPS